MLFLRTEKGKFVDLIYYPQFNEMLCVLLKVEPFEKFEDNSFRWLL
jgi:hypothetical protein